MARQSKTTEIAWILESDLNVMILIERSEQGHKKTPKNLCEIVHDVAAAEGIPEVRLTDHDCEPRTTEDLLSWWLL